MRVRTQEGGSAVTAVLCEECGEREAKIYVAGRPRPMVCYACWSKTPVTREEDEAFREKSATQRV